MSKENTGKELLLPVFFYADNDCNNLYPKYGSAELYRFEDDSVYARLNPYYRDSLEFFGKEVDMPEEMIAIFSLSKQERVVE